MVAAPEFESGRKIVGVRILLIMHWIHDADDIAVASFHGPCIRDRKKGREEHFWRTAEKHLAERFSASRSEKS